MNKIFFKCFFALLLAAICYTLPAQQAENLTIEGTVTDGTTGETLPGVTIVVKGRIGGTTSDINGKFSIRANRGEWLVFSFVGYESFDHLVTEETRNLKVSISESSQEIEEVVITGVGAQRKISTLASISTVDAKDLQAPAPSVVNLLSGKVAGVYTMQMSGEPGKNLAEFWVRGVGTFGANDAALVLIDGIEGDINSIDPADIESFSILKDASATAVYGVRGANGVVLITTKRGESGKINITGRFNTTISHLQRLPEYLRAYDYATLVNEAMAVRGEAPRYNDIQLKVIKDGLDPDFYPDVSWQDEIVRRLSFKQTYFASARGGSDIARYYVSLGGSSESAAYRYEKDNPSASNAGYKTYSFRTNLDLNITKTTTLKFNADAFMSVNDRPGDIDDTDYIWNAQATITPLNYPIRYSNGQLPSLPTGYGWGISPYVLINHTGYTKLTDYKTKISISLDQDLGMIAKGLKMTVLGAYDRNGGYTESRTQRPALYIADGRDFKGDLRTVQSIPPSTSSYYEISSNTDRQYRRFLLESTVFYDRVFGSDHRVNALAKLYMDDEFGSRQWTANDMEGLPRNLQMIPRRYLRLTGNVGYGFRDTYMVTFNFGYTGTENFAPGRQYGFFPSIALGWIPSNYEIVKNNMPWLDFFKIRASYGIVGNDRIGGQRFPYLNRVQEGYGSIWSTSSVVEKINILRVGADNLVWEEAKKSNIGVDARLFKDAVSFTVDFFQDKRDGIFQRRAQVPGYAGLTENPFGNVGSMMSWGSDGNITFTHDINKDMSVTIRGNYSYAQNKVLNWERAYDLYPYQGFDNLPRNLTRGLQCLGFFKDEFDVASSPRQSWSAVMPGDLKYKDVNGDGIVNNDDRVPIGHEQTDKRMFPLWNYGFGGTFSYQKLSIGILFQGVGKQDYYRNNFGYIPFQGQNTGNVLKTFADPATRWIPMWYAEANGIDPSLAENPNALLPRLQYGQNTNNSQLSDFWKADARYLRLKEVTINYNMRNDFLKRIGINSLDLQLVGANLFVWDKVKDFDPEQAHRRGTVYPIPSTYSFQIYINL